ncbi:MAG: Hint domain-containing protein [Methyloceanibacter sp.]|uniref:Hint domain-containing protein n=1 Tax=Methyloceanibacter sp. TaxID=1965321 RepID=UPI003D9BB1AC
MSTDNKRSAVGAHLQKPDLKTSRRNFIAGVSTLAGALVATAVARKPAVADHTPGHACDTSAEPHNPHCLVCFLSGTRIATPDGDVAVEKLRIGDLVTCVSGSPTQIKFIGRSRHTRAASEAWRPGLTPVKVSRFALDGRTPHADLYLSRGHSVYLDGLLVPVQNLVNGLSIIENCCADALTLEYYHIDLENHAVVFAEGAPAETWQGDKYWTFDNADEYVRLYGVPKGMKQPFAPILSYHGRRRELVSRLRSVVSPIYDVREPLDVIRDEIAARAELALA